ncbi:MAG: hypothetical protein PHS17_16170 [Desulfobacterales bacterium]|nr:hypothetical protein [Desulfobacterales bacterium]
MVDYSKPLKQHLRESQIRWFDSLRGGKYIVVVVISEDKPSTRHWVVTAYMARKLAGGDIEWKKS